MSYKNTYRRNKDKTTGVRHKTYPFNFTGGKI